jgi:hypothetical protein
MWWSVWSPHYTVLDNFKHLQLLTHRVVVPIQIKLYTGTLLPLVWLNTFPLRASHYVFLCTKPYRIRSWVKKQIIKVHLKRWHFFIKATLFLKIVINDQSYFTVPVFGHIGMKIPYIITVHQLQSLSQNLISTIIKIINFVTT